MCIRDREIEHQDKQQASSSQEETTNNAFRSSSHSERQSPDATAEPQEHGCRNPDQQEGRRAKRRIGENDHVEETENQPRRRLRTEVHHQHDIQSQRGTQRAREEDEDLDVPERSRMRLELCELDDPLNPRIGLHLSLIHI